MLIIIGLSHIFNIIHNVIEGLTNDLVVIPLARPIGFSPRTFNSMGLVY